MAGKLGAMRISFPETNKIMKKSWEKLASSRLFAVICRRNACPLNIATCGKMDKPEWTEVFFSGSNSVCSVTASGRLKGCSMMLQLARLHRRQLSVKKIERKNRLLHLQTPDLSKIFKHIFAYSEMKKSRPNSKRNRTCWSWFHHDCVSSQQNWG